MHEALVDAAHHEEVEQGVLADVVDAGGHDEEQLEAEVLEARRLVADQELVQVRDELQDGLGGRVEIQWIWSGFPGNFQVTFWAETRGAFQ